MLKVMNFIVDRQRDFFEKGIEYLKPLTLREVAEVINMHESTVSRVVTNKYMHTPQGVFDDFKAFVAKVRKAQPNVPIAFIAIKPSVARKSLMAPMHQANDMIQAWAATQKNVTFLDIWPDMLDKNGQPRPELFIQDGLHMNRQGYDIWVAKVTPWLKSLH